MRKPCTMRQPFRPPPWDDEEDYFHRVERTSDGRWVCEACGKQFEEEEKEP